jgi:perosamine synthetase
VTVAQKLPFSEPLVEEAYATALKEQALSGYLGPGPATVDFATALVNWSGARHVVPVTSGTVALSVAAKALGLEPGDEVLVPAYGVVATINAFATIGLRPRLVEIERATGCMDPAALDEMLSPRTKAVCYVNFSGHTGAGLVAVAGLCRDRGIPLIEDACCALGQRYEGQAAGTFGTVGTYSFSVPKIVTTGQGGAVLSNDSDIHDRACCFVDHGDLEWRRTGIVRTIGTNLRFNDLLSAYGLAQLARIDALLARKRETHAALRAGLNGRLFTVPGGEAPLHNIVFSPEPEKLVTALDAVGIATQRPYRTVSQHPPYAHLAERAYSNADYWTDRAVYLPCALTVSVTDAQRIVDAVSGAGVGLSDLDDINAHRHL